MVRWLALLGMTQHPVADQVRTEIRGTISVDRGAVAGRAAITVPRTLLGSGGRVRLGITRKAGQRIDISAAGDSAGRTIEVALLPDSTAVEVAVPGAGPTVTVMVDFTTRLDSASRADLGYYLETATSPEETWYPRMAGLPDSLARFQRFDLALTVPNRVALLVTGSLVDSIATDGGRQYQFQASDVEGVALAVGDGFRIRTEERDSLIVRTMVPLGQATPLSTVGATTLAAMAWYRDTFGFFPVPQIGIVPGSQRARGGFPLPGMFMLHRGDLSPGFLRWITAHELAHYYWGLHVLDPDERLGWLSLGLGIWTDQLYLSATSKQTLEDQWRDSAADNALERYAEALLAKREQRLGLSGAAADSLDFDYHSIIRHGKAATGIYLLSRQLDTDRFTSLLRSLLREYRHRPLGPADFGRALERAGLADATSFLNSWVKGDARLDYRVVRSRRDSRTGNRATIVVERTGTVAYPITLGVVARNGSTTKVPLEGRALIDSITVDLPAPLASVAIDPDGVLPMVSSEGVAMRRVFLRAASRVSPPARFQAAAETHLRTDPDPIVAALLLGSYFEAGQHAAVRRVANQVPEAVRCTERIRCLAGLQVARSLRALGMTAGAQTWLSNLEGAMVQLGLGAHPALGEAQREIRGGKPQ